jgi:hypothetical protein
MAKTLLVVLAILAGVAAPAIVSAPAQANGCGIDPQGGHACF